MAANFNPSDEEKLTDGENTYESSSSINATLFSNQPSSRNTTTDDSIQSTILIPSYFNTKTEQTRGLLATIFILGFFIMFILGGLLVALNNDPSELKVKNLQDVFLVISGVLSGPLGFVVGYYFRKQEEVEDK